MPRTVSQNSQRRSRHCPSSTIPPSIPTSTPLRSSAPVITSALKPVPIPIQGRIVIRVSLTPEQVPEHPPQVRNVGLGLKLQRTTIRQILGELRGTSLTKCGDRYGLLLLHNELVLLRGTLGLEPLPRQYPLDEVY